MEGQIRLTLLDRGDVIEELVEIEKRLASSGLVSLGSRNPGSNPVANNAWDF